MGVFGNTFGNTLGGQGLLSQTPLAPTALSLSVTSSTQIDLAFTVNEVLSKLDGSRIYISTDGINFSEKGTVSGVTATYSATGLTAETVYTFKVVSYKGSNESDPTSNVAATTFNSIFDTVTRAWAFSESGMRRDSKASGDDFFPTGVTVVDGFTVLDGSSSYLACDGTTIGLGDDTSFTISFTLKPTSTTGTRWIFDKGVASGGTQSEWYIYHSGATVFFRVCDGTNQTTVSAGSISVGTATKITCGYDAVNRLISIKVANASLATTAHTTTTYFQYGSLIVGTSPDNYADAVSYIGGIKDIIFWRGTYLNAAQQTTLHAASFPFALMPAQDITLDPDTLDSQYSRHDFSDLTTLFTDAAKTTNVTADTDPIRVIASKWGTHDWSAPSDAVRPVFKANILGGRGAGLWNGIDTNIIFDQALPGNAPFTLFVIAQNNRNSSLKGSHVLHNPTTASYLAYTGSDYPAGTYVAAHMQDEGAVITGTFNNPTGFNIVELARKNTGETIITENGDTPRSLSDFKRTFTDPFDPDRIGDDLYAGVWWFSGYAAEYIMFSRYMDVSERARVRKFLETKWTLSNVKYKGF